MAKSINKYENDGSFLEKFMKTKPEEIKLQN